MKLKDTVHFDLPKKLLIGVFVLLLCYQSILVTHANFGKVFQNFGQLVEFLSRFMNPDFGYIPQLIQPMLKTLQMSVVGTVLGVVFAVPFSFLATSVATENSFVSTTIRFILGIIRTIPNLLLAALFVAMFGIGEVTGIITIAVFTFGMVSQLLYEAIETIDFGPIETTKSVGATKLQIASFAIFPQIMPHVISYALYAFEVNVRASTILGYVGAGGIGVMLSSSLALLRYDRVSITILMILLVVFMCDALSEALRKKVI